MLEQGLVLMGAGMGVVGLFLTTMVIVMYLSAIVLKRFDKEPPKKNGGDTKKSGPGDLSEIAVAIAAVKSHTSG